MACPGSSRFAVAGATLVASVLLCLETPQAQDPANDAPRLWEQVVAAKGGRERLHRIETLVVRMSASPRGLGQPDQAEAVVMEAVMSLPDRLWLWSDARPSRLGYMTNVWNAPKRIDSSSLDGGPARGEWSASRGFSQSIMIWQILYCLETQWLRPTVLERSSTPKAPRQATVTVQIDGFASVRYEIDLASSLPLSVHLVPLVRDVSQPDFLTAPLIAGRPEDYEFEQFVDVAGVKMPSRYRKDGRVRYLEFIVNPDVDPRLFETPPNHVKRSDAWRAFLRK